MTRCRAYLACPLVALAFAALILSAAIHMRIGLKEIIEDYVHGGAKVIAILLATFFAVGRRPRLRPRSFSRSVSES